LEGLWKSCDPEGGTGCGYRRHRFWWKGMLLNIEFEEKTLYEYLERPKSSRRCVKCKYRRRSGHHPGTRGQHWRNTFISKASLLILRLPSGQLRHFESVVLSKRLISERSRPFGECSIAIKIWKDFTTLSNNTLGNFKILNLKFEDSRVWGKSSSFACSFHF